MLSLARLAQGGWLRMGVERGSKEHTHRFILFLEAVWGLQQVFSAVFGLFAVAKVVSSYEKY